MTGWICQCDAAGVVAWMTRTGIDAGPLLEEHDETGKRDAFEGVFIADEAAVLGEFPPPDAVGAECGEELVKGAFFELDVSFDLEKFGAYKEVVFG